MKKQKEKRVTPGVRAPLNMSEATYRAKEAAATKRVGKHKTRAEELAHEITDQINSGIISKGSGVSTSDCLDALETIRDYCGEWIQQIRSEHPEE